MSKNNVDLGFAFNLPPEKAIEYFQSKGYTIGFNWQDVWQDAHTKAFTVAGILKQDVLEDIKKSLDDALANGIPFQAWKKNISPILAQKGWLGETALLLGDENGEMIGKRLTPHRLETIYRTNMTAAAMAGHYQELLENADNRPFWQYSAVNDNRTRPSHSALDGRVYRYDDPFWDYFYPPNGWNCRCTVVALKQRDLDHRGLTLSESSPEQFVDVDQVVGKQTRQAVGFKLNSERVFVTDAGFNYNVGKSHVANLGKALLEKGVTVNPMTAAVAINETFANPKLMQAVVNDFADVVKQVRTNIDQGVARPQGRVWHIGALLPSVVSKLQKSGVKLDSAVISADENALYHSMRDNKGNRKGVDKRLSVDFWASLPERLLQPKAVVQDLHQNEPTLLYIFDDSKVGKVAIRLNYNLKVKGGDPIKTNMLRSGEIISNMNTLKDKQKFKLLWGEL